MRWSPGPISKNIEDRRFEYINPEQLLGQLQQGYGADPNAVGSDVPPWMFPGPPTTEAAVNPDYLAFLRSFNLGGR
jgi:hypothetical protein